MTTAPLTHESGHCVALMHFGVRVLSVTATDDGGGEVIPAREVADPGERAVSFLAGCAADRYCSNWRHPASAEDIEGANRAGVEWARATGHTWSPAALDLFRFYAERFVEEHELAIRWLARRLGQHGGRLDAVDLSRLTRESCSSLRAYSHLYDPPPEALARKSSPLAGARWSDEHRCFLRRRPGPAREVRVTVAGAFR